MRAAERVAPLPQVGEHGVQGLHAETVQLMGHGCVLQACTPARAGQSAPPYIAGATIVRDRFWTPLSHEALHGVHADQDVTEQGMGQGDSVGQGWAMTRAGQAMPLNCGATVMERVRVLLLGPHVAVHADHSDHVLTLQLMGGQACSPTQGTVVTIGGQFVPEVVFTRVPDPHVAEHVEKVVEVYTHDGPADVRGR